MSKSAQLLYRFRGIILGALALALLAMPAEPFPWDLTNCSDKYRHVVAKWDVFALVLLFIGVALRIKTRQYIGNHTRGSVHQAETLVTWGPYALIRHPLYYSNMSIAIFFAFIHLGPSLILIPFLFAIVLFEWALSRIEDKFLHEKFGEEWESWAREVPALNFGRNPFFGSGKEEARAKYFAKKPVRTVWQSFCADCSTWVWLLFFNLLIVLTKIYLT